MWLELLQALCLMLILEGIIPFLYPGRWRKLVNTLSQINDSQIRIVGLLSMLVGLALLMMIK